ncbi:Flp family type IVb pilin [Parasphingopyxis sp. CP4]|uniref:Flp family type IVb pilin n=1 Tax=Parasphingopyxis sp. CP4 TaxID=2724527 RepID=UPI0015A28821|nr:Flp family type IVb pilin [Parasphingopyxis sp. CP4]QLC21155.1 Flp family type IVb pilin [Parasphingopyxis sp. CP4]
MKNGLRKIVRDERGATVIEYGLIVSLVVLAMVGALGTVAGTTTNMWNDVSNEVTQD